MADDLIERLRGQSAIPNRNEVADRIAALEAQVAAFPPARRQILTPTTIAASQTPDPAANALGAEWMRREAVSTIDRQLDGASMADDWCRGWVAGIKGVSACVRDIPAPTEDDLDRAALARPKVVALIKWLKSKTIMDPNNSNSTWQDAGARAALAALQKGDSHE